MAENGNDIVLYCKQSFTPPSPPTDLYTYSRSPSFQMSFLLAFIKKRVCWLELLCLVYFVRVGFQMQISSFPYGAVDTWRHMCCFQCIYWCHEPQWWKMSRDCLLYIHCNIQNCVLYQNGPGPCTNTLCYFEGHTKQYVCIHVLFRQVKALSRVNMPLPFMHIHYDHQYL